MVHVESIVLPSPDSISVGVTFYLVYVLTLFKPMILLVPVLIKEHTFFIHIVSLFH